MLTMAGAEGANSARNRSGKWTTGLGKSRIDSGERRPLVPTDGAGARSAFKLSGFWTEGRQGFHASDCPAALLLLGQ